MFFKEPLTEWFLWNQKWFFCGIAVKNLLRTFIFKSALIFTSSLLSDCYFNSFINMKMIHKPNFTTALLLDGA